MLGRCKLLFAIALVGPIPSFALAAPDGKASPARARQLEQQLMAPCCYQQTLDIHGSEPADKLRAEIRQRLAAGETVLQVRDDLVARYGSKLLAVPATSPLPLVALLALLGILAAGLMLWLRARAWVGRPASQEQAAAEQQDGYDLELDEALRRLDT